jgi:magnesium chelatase family protein
MRVSGPLLDRIDLVVAVTRAGLSPDAAPWRAGDDSATVRERVSGAARLQRQRAGQPNARLDAAGFRKHCRLEGAARALLEAAGSRYALSARAMDSVRRVARTIADLAGAEDIGPGHLSEALALRADRTGFGAARTTGLPGLPAGARASGP